MRSASALQVPCAASSPGRVLILGESHLRTVLAAYQAHYNTARPHQGIAQCIPDGDGDGGHLTVADLDREQIPKTRPGRPARRILTRRLTPRRLAGHQPNPTFEQDSL
jgi:hypothetical protein